MVQMDITDIRLSDNVFSIIYCSHVLEHIPDDRKALSELYRVLKPGGWAVLKVPVGGDETYEDFTIVDPEERKEHFGQSDHVRRCGRDYVERIRAAGFIAECVRATDLITESECHRMRIWPEELIFFCQKATSP